MAVSLKRRIFLTMNPALKIVLAIPLLLVAWFAILSLLSQRGKALGLRDRKLAPCSSKPNGVSSESGTPATNQMEPIRISGIKGPAWDRLLEEIRALGGSVKTNEPDHYLWATFSSKLFRFVDDLECRMDTTSGHIHLRSASRVGRSDFGANRQRVEALRAAVQGR